MDAIDKVAIAKVVKPADAKTASGLLETGEHTVDAFVHITGTLRKAEDELSAPTVSLSVLETLALALKFSGVTGDNAKKVIRQTVETALTADSKSKGALTEQYDWLEDEVKALKKEVIAKLPKIEKAGKVTTKLTVEVVNGKLVQGKDAVIELEDNTEAEGVS